MTNKRVKQMMIDVENNILGIKGYKNLDTLVGLDLINQDYFIVQVQILYGFIKKLS